MSRALDPETIAALDKIDPAAAYHQISSALTPPSSGPLLDIEILPPSHFPQPFTHFVLRDGPAVGISKLGLVQAFLHARQRLQSYLSSSFSSQPHHSHQGEEQDDEAAILALTSTILLFDPEHLTAANTRKRLLLRHLSSSPSSSGAITSTSSPHHSSAAADSSLLRALVNRDLRLIDSLLTSRLHRHTKSPTLWNHRRWLVTQLASRGLLVLLDDSDEAGGGGGGEAEVVVRTLTEVVGVAGERHERNYYAWGHARFLMGLIRGGKGGERGGGGDGKVVEVIKRWCFQHHTDISGWAFLGYLLGLGRQQRQQEQSGGDGGDGEGGIGVEGRKEAERVFAEVLDLVENLRLANESVWVFLRTMTASGLVGEEMVARYKEVQAKVLETALEPRDQAVLKAAVDWSERYRRRDGPRLGKGEGEYCG